MFKLPEKSPLGITPRTWVFIVILLLLTPICDLIDINDMYFHNVLWFCYLIITIIIVFKKGTLCGIAATIIEAIIFLSIESLDKSLNDGFKYITLAELIIVNILISLTLGRLFKEKIQKHLELKETKNFLESIFNNSDIAIWSDDWKDKHLLSKGIEKIYGLKRDEAVKNRDFWKQCMYPEDRYLSDIIEKKQKRHEDYEFEYRIVHSNGEIRWVHEQGKAVLNEKADLLRYDGTIADITSQKKLEIFLKESGERYKNLVENVHMGVYMIQNNEPFFVNQWFAELIGVQKQDLLRGTNFLNYIAQKDLLNVRKNFQNLIDGKVSFFIEEIQIITLSGEVKILELQAAVTTVNEAPAIIGIALDITDKKKAKAELEHIAYHDGLTGLPNMNYLNHFIAKKFNQSILTGIPICLMYFNLDRFKLINDTFGHRTGDQLLKVISNRLADIINNAGTVIRAGGDDFIFYLPNTDQSQAEEFARDLMNVFSEPFEFEKQEIRIAASIGITIAEKNDSLEEVVQKAGAALHFAKEFGRGQFRFYFADFGRITNRRLQLEQRLSTALKEEKLEVYYQPKLDLRTSQIAGMEALLRWNDPILGVVSPEEFIPIAEETGMIIPLGKWVLEAACRQNREWEKNGYRPLQVCVNISSRQFLQDDFTDMIEKILAKSELDPDHLNLEITEGIALYSIEDAIEKLEKIKKLGVKISLDDFGTGYSSLSYIKSLPIHFLKIDRSFIKGIIENNQDAEIIHSVISLAHSLDFRVVAEGVENEQQLNALAKMNCDEIQGFYFAKPMDAVKFEQFIKEMQPKSC